MTRSISWSSSSSGVMASRPSTSPTTAPATRPPELASMAAARTLCSTALVCAASLPPLSSSPLPLATASAATCGGEIRGGA